jgi:hypothetical protein
MRNALLRAGLVLGLAAVPATAFAQKALVYCPPQDQTGCNAVVTALTGSGYPGGVDKAYDGTGGTVDIRTVDLFGYSVFVVPSLADDATSQPYSFLRDAQVQEHLRAALIGGLAVWSGTPDQGSTNRAGKDQLIRNLAGWAGGSYAQAHGPGLVALLDLSETEGARYDWLRSMTPLQLASDVTMTTYDSVRTLTATGAAIRGSLAYQSMAALGLATPTATPGLRIDALGATTTTTGGQVVLATLPAGNTSTARISTDKLDYSPGQTVTISGTGWAAGEAVTITLHEDPLLEQDSSWVAVADGFGHFSSSAFAPDVNDIGTRFVLTADGGTSGMRAQATFTDAAPTPLLYADAAHTDENYIFTRGSTVFAFASGLNTGEGFKFEVKDASGLVKHTSSCLTGSNTQSDSYTILAGDVLSGTADWSYTIYHWAGGSGGTCPGAFTDFKTSTFDVAQATAYTSSSLTTPTTSYSQNTTAFVRVAGLSQSAKDWIVTWILPNGSTACENNAGGDRPASATDGSLPTTGNDVFTPSTTTFLQYRPNQTDIGDQWNWQSKYETSPCPSFLFENSGQWKLTLLADAKHSVTFNIFNVSVAVPTVLTLTASPANSAPAGTSVTFTANVATQSAGTPTGTIQFKDGTTNLGAPVALNGSGSAQLTTSSLTAGSHTISAVYSGDANYAADTESITYVIGGDLYTATISPTQAVTSTTTTFTVTFVNGSPTVIGKQAKIGIPAGFSVGATSVATTLGASVTATQMTAETVGNTCTGHVNGVWTGDGALVSGGNINLKASGGSAELCPGASLVVRFQAATSTFPGTYTFVTQFMRDGNLFDITGSQPSVLLKSNQTITVTTAAPATAVYNTTFNVAATASSGLPVAITATGVCSVQSGGSASAVIHMDSGTGTCTVHYNQAGDASFNPAPEVTSNTTAQKATQTITVGTAAPATAVYNTTFGVAATSNSSLAVAITSTGVCSGSGSGSATITMTSGTGTCTVHYNQAGDANYLAATEVTSPTTAQKASQTINVTTPAPVSAVYNTSFGVAATSSSSLAVAVTSTGVCSGSGSASATIHMDSGTGTCTVHYNQAGDANFDPAPEVTSATTASKASQTINVTTAAPANATFNTSFGVAASASSSLAVAISSTGVCSGSGSATATIHMDSGTGTCTVHYNQAGDANFTAATEVTSATTADKAAQAISVTTAAPATAVYNTTFNVAATGGASGNPVTIAGSGVCSGSGNGSATITMTSGTGTCTVTYDQVGNANYSAATQVTSSTTAQKANQTVNVTTPAPASAVYNTTFGVAATASSGLAVAITSSSVCSGTGSGSATITMTSGTGTCTVHYNQAGDANFNSAPEVTNSTTAEKANQTISVTTAAPGSAEFNTSFNVAATASSGLGVAITSSGVCSGSGTGSASIHMDAGTGTCTVSYNQAGDANFNAATQVTNSTTATKASQTITVTQSAPASAVFNTSFNVAATGGASGSPVVIASSGACSGGGNGSATIHMDTGTGTCTVTYNQAGNTNYNPATQATETTTAQKAAQAINVTIAAPASAVYNTSFNVAATGGASGSPVVIASSGACSGSGNGSATITMTSGTGTCSVTYNQAGNADYDAAPQASNSTTAQKATQSINVTTHAPASAVFNTSFGVAATATSGLAVAITSSSVCSGSGSGSATITMTSGTGTCTVHYNQAGDDNFSAATEVTENTTAAKANQTINVTMGAPGTAEFNTSFNVAATANSSLAVAITSSGVCTGSGSGSASIHMDAGTGTCTVHYNQAGDADYNAATEVTSSTSATKADQIITVTTHAPASAVFNTSFNVAATGGGSGSPVVIAGSGACSGTGNGSATIHMDTGTGTCTVTYNQAGNTNYNPATQVTETTTAEKAAQAINVTTAAPASAVYNTSFNVAATGGASANPVVIASSGACSGSGNGSATIHMDSGTGTCSVTYNQAGNADYDAAPQASNSTTAQKATQSINVTTHAPASAVFNTSFGVAATATSGLAVAITSSSVCSGSGSGSATITMTSGTGTCTVHYNQAGDDNFSAATEATDNTTAEKANQTINVTTAAPGSAEFNTSFNVAATANSSLPVAITSSGACSGSGTSSASIHMDAGTGTCTVHYNQAGDADYNAATEVTSSTSATKASQTITVTTHAPASAAFNSSFTVAATGGASGNPVTYSATGVCSNVGATFTMNSGSGTCTVHYNQAGDANYDPATQVTEDVTATMLAQVITVTTSAPATAAFNSSFTVAATGGASGNPVTYSATGVCTNVGATFTMTSGTGTCTVHYNQAGNASYAAAPEVTEATTASKIAPTVTFTGAPSTKPYLGTFTVASTTNSSAGPAYTSSGACSNSGTLYTMSSGSGTCTSTVTWLADANYTGATLSQSTTATQGSTTTSVANANATSSVSSQNVTFSATVTGSMVNEGTVTFTLKNASNVVVGVPTTSGTVVGSAASVSYSVPGGTPAGTYTILAEFSGSNFANSSGTGTLTIASGDTQKPVVSNTQALPVALNTVGSVTATISDAGLGNNKIVSWYFTIDGVAQATVNIASGSQAITVNVTGSIPGSSATDVREICVYGTDAAGNTSIKMDCALQAIYDPSAGFVTGGGWIMSPTGAYAANPSLTGKATFGFVSKYTNGRTIPTGNTEFQFQTASFNFSSTVYEWLVVSGALAQYKGSGTINGSGDYGFLLSAVDGSLTGGGGTDKFRIKIWNKTTGAVIYDNNNTLSDTATPTTVLGGGSIVIHR